MKFPLACIITLSQIFCTFGGLLAESQEAFANFNVSHTDEQQGTEFELRDQNSTPNDDLAIFTPETQALILRERQLAILNRSVLGNLQDRENESSEETQGLEQRVTEIGLITLQEYIVIPWESREAQRLLAEGLILYTEEARERVLKEKYLSSFDRDFINRWELKFLAGTSAAERANMYEEQARFARFEELTKKFLASLKDNRSDAYEDLKKLYLEERHERIENQRNILGLHRINNQE
ncbi:MAG: hypothetical protein DF168_00623 [Candidatus Moanabacter tarae]|uniref:Uncharacterized protein n=1 Tax=Candidatus Moanibacter tarae TaxID=2200854 RepID=A0A2Z4AGY5_9BACT|nr:MAG: hypothetical protein DF168_00623 [Candidatus Moanabacter tarae]|tara:strand:- start:9827 stop:10540 length:714 start_codon:yes stop_codon:yes gene_type:complete